jgi:hypothetical protein
VANADYSVEEFVGEEPCIVRFRLTGMFGRTTLHCHILKHEDAGTMGWINVRNNGTFGEEVVAATPTSPCCISGTCSECVDENNLPNACPTPNPNLTPTYFPTSFE